MLGIYSVLNLYLLSKWMKNLVSTWPNLFHSALSLLAIQMAQLTLGIQANWFITLISASRFWDDWKCYLFFLPIDIHVSLLWKPERNCTNIWNAYSCLFSKPYAFISVTISPICSADKAASDKVSDEGRTKSFLRAKSALNPNRTDQHVPVRDKRLTGLLMLEF